MSNSEHIDHDFTVGETVYIRGEGTTAGGEVRGIFVGKDGRLNYVIEMPRTQPRELSDPALLLAAIYYQTIMNANGGAT